MGGTNFDVEAWKNQMEEQFDWVKSKIESLVINKPSEATSVVIFGHGFPTDYHRKFFNPLKEYLKDDLNNELPIIYINGDKHEYDYANNFRGLSNFNRLQLEGGVRDPPLQFTVKSVHADYEAMDAHEVFFHDRMK